MFKSNEYYSESHYNYTYHYWWGTFITIDTGYYNRHRIGVNNYVSPPMKTGTNIPPDSAKRLRLGGVVVYDIRDNRISNTVTPFRVSR